MDSWPDYTNVADWERMYTLKEVFGVYETKYAKILATEFARNPILANALKTAHMTMMIGEMSDPDTMQAYMVRPGYRWDAMMPTGLGMADTGMFNIVSSARLEHTAFNNPWFQLLAAIFAQGGAAVPYNKAEDIEFGLNSPYYHNLIRTITDTLYGSGQINLGEFAFNMWQDRRDYAEHRNGSTDGWLRSLLNDPRRMLTRMAEASGPRLSSFFAALAEEPYPIGQDRHAAGFWEGLVKLITGLQIIHEDPDLIRKKVGRARGTIRDISRDILTQKKRDAARSERQGKQATVPVREIVRRGHSRDKMENEMLAVALANSLGYHNIPNLIRIVEEARGAAVSIGKQRSDMTESQTEDLGREITLDSMIKQREDALQNLIRGRQE
jgi:hypothetical protein